MSEVLASAAPPPEHFGRRVNTLAVAWCVSALAFSITFPFLPLYLHKQRNIPMDRVGLVFLLMGVANMAGPLVAGALVDAIGRRKVLIAGPLARAGAFAVLAVLAAVDAPLWALAVAVSVSAFLGAFFGSASHAYVTDITPPHQRPDAFGRLRIGTNLGWMTGPAIGAFLARTPFWLLFALTGALCLVTAGIAWRFCPEPDASADRRARGEPVAVGPAAMLAPLRRDRALALHLLFALLLFLLSSQLVSTLSVFATEVVGISRNWVGGLYTANGLVVIVLQWPINWLLRRSNLALRTAAGALLYAAGYFAVSLAGGHWELIGCIVIITCGEMLTEPAIVSAVSRMASERNVGLYMGLYGLTRGLGYSVGPFIGGVLYGHLHGLPMLLWGLLAVGAVLAALGFVGRQNAPAMRQ